MTRLVARPDFWWPEILTPPPATWAYLTEELTQGSAGDEWAMAAAHLIAAHRSREGRGPTFREVFEHLLPDFEGLPGPFPNHLTEDQRAFCTNSFRMYAMHAWRRTGLFAWRKGEYRSLHVLWRFSAERHLRKSLQ